jgi:hypothetical protein
MDRKPIPAEVETVVLLKSARRCPLCFHLNVDLAEKIGQIAHLDRNPSNSAEDNLAFLCLDHHTLFDSKTSQHKNYTIHEVKAARADLYKAIAQRRHLGEGPFAGWQHFNYDKTSETGGRKLCEDVVLGNFISYSIPAPCTMREIVEQIALHSQRSIPVDSLVDSLALPILPRGKVLFGYSGDCIDQVLGNREDLEWWISDKGLNVSTRNSHSICQDVHGRYD